MNAKSFILSTFLMGMTAAGFCQELLTRYELSGGTQTASYAEAIDWYNRLDQQSGTIQMTSAGRTDVAHPLHVVYYSGDKRFDVRKWKEQNKVIILINNGIHPGEPDGIDASMMLLRDAALGKIKVPEQVVLAVIPIFNIGGALNRGSYSRANQNGPEAFGFRGNAQNLDLNRDFIKMDARETQSLVKLFHQLNPDIFIDNHVSNGADYQHVMTLLSGNEQKTGSVLGSYLSRELEPWIYKDMALKGFDLVPYVNHWGHTPDSGWRQFYDLPRFASGFTALFGTLAFVPETHMLKPYNQRVKATYELMVSFIRFAGENGERIKDIRRQEAEQIAQAKELVIDWQVDTTRFTGIAFKGYEAAYKPSEVSGLPRLYYDKNKPYEKTVRFYNYFLPAATATVPRYYIIRQGWHRVVSRLKMNGVQMSQLRQDSTVELTTYRITDYETSRRPYEGHYLHSKVRFKTGRETVRLLKGDYLIPLNQPARRYLVETLEPNAPDAFFAWGFFDAILQQKEYFSDYVFEDEAARLLSQQPSLREKLQARKTADSSFAKDAEAQLDFIYRNSPWYEPSHLLYPVFRID